MPDFPSAKGCRPRRGPLRPSCSASHPPLECESDSSGPDCPNNHQEQPEVYSSTGSFEAPKHTKMQEENARDKKQYAAALDETKLEFRFVHFLILAKQTKRRSVTAVNRRLRSTTSRGDVRRNLRLSHTASRLFPRALPSAARIRSMAAPSHIPAFLAPSSTSTWTPSLSPWKSCSILR